jgi:type III restriction enzyme
MELKPYQKQVIDDLAFFLEKIQETKNVITAYASFWENHPRTPLLPTIGSVIESYKNNIKGVPHVCVKVPTAGGKTFIACNALKTIFDTFAYEKPKAVVWLVPSTTILEQTIKNLRDISHPYRQKINTHFGNKVEIFDKATLLNGNGFNPSSVKEQLNIFVLSFDSIRTANKEGRKVFQENGALQTFGASLGEDEEVSLMAIMKMLNPVVIVDESHNAETDLSVEMLKNFNPCFILDLTATPRKNSNIISFIDAIALKQENMVKLPVIVYNHQDKTDVIISALDLQKKLENAAKEERKKGGKYIRPIVLFQAQPKNANDSTTFQKLKAKLIQLGIPENQIKIKTSEINEIAKEDLMHENCKVRYIITVNALKEGWDCPFAYILASLADKSSAVDVEQILGRVLRQPYVSKHISPFLNLSYVLTASSKFDATLVNIVKGLNKAGFSDKSAREENGNVIAKDLSKQEKLSFNAVPTQQTPTQEENDDIDVNRILESQNISNQNTNNQETINENNTIEKPSILSEIEKIAIEQTENFDKKVAELAKNGNNSSPNEIKALMKTYNVKDKFKERIGNIILPQFHLKVDKNSIFGTQAEELLLDKNNLLADFQLSKSDTNIDFENVNAQLYKVDLDADNENKPSFVRLDNTEKKGLMLILDMGNKQSRIKNFTKRIMSIIGNMYPIADEEIKRYITRILDDLKEEQFIDFANNENSYTDKIKAKIVLLSQEFAEEQFKNLINIDKVVMKPSFKFPLSISPTKTCEGVTKSLYSKEGEINGYELHVINKIASMPNIEFWTRNIDRKGFKINGFINHYPDFIIQTIKGKTIILETKGDHLDAESKINLGKLWAEKAGNNYRYYLVYEKRDVNGTYKLDEFLNFIKEM